jgi:hypothetical protein
VFELPDSEIFEATARKLGLLDAVLYHDAEIQALIQLWQPTHTEESFSLNEVITSLLNNADHQTLDALLPPIKRAGFQAVQALSQHQSQQKGGGRKR